MFTLIKTEALKYMKSDAENLRSMYEEIRCDLFNQQRRVEELEAQLMHAENSARIARELLSKRDQNA